MSQCSLSRTLLATESSRVKSVTFLPSHLEQSAASPTRLLVTLYSGDAELWQIASEELGTQQLQQALLEARYSLSSSPIRSGTFIGTGASNIRVCCACDDGNVYVSREALPSSQHAAQSVPGDNAQRSAGTHGDMLKIDVSNSYVRSVASHPLNNGFFTASDDGQVKMFIYDSIADEYICQLSHNKHFLMAMQVAVAPVGSQKFLKVCSVSQDMKIIFWFPESNKFEVYENKHLPGINCVAFHPDSTQPLLLTGGDDNTVNLWNYSNDTILKKFTNFSAPLTSVAFSQSHPLILAAAEDNTIRAFKINNFKEVLSFKPEKEKITNRQNMGRVWSIAESKTGFLAAGYDNGLHVYNFTKSNTLFQIDSRLKLFYSQGKQIMQQNLGSVKVSTNQDLNSISSKSIGVCEYDEIEGLSLSSNGKYIVISSNDQEFAVYSSLALRNQIFGKSDLCPVFSTSSDLLFSTRGSKIIIYSNNFKTTTETVLGFKPSNLFAGKFMAIYSQDSAETLFFTEDSNPKKICSIPLEMTNIFWNKYGNLALVNTESKSFLIAFDLDLIESEKFDKCYRTIFKFESPASSCLFSKNHLLVAINNKVECIYFSSDNFNTFEQTLILPFIEGTLLYSPTDANIVTIEFTSADSPVYRMYNINFDLLKFKQNVLSKNIEKSSEIFGILSVDQRESALNFLEKHKKLDIIYSLIEDKVQKAEIALKLNLLEDALELSSSENQLEKILIQAIEQKRSDIAIKVIKISKNPNLSLQLLLILSGVSEPNSPQSKIYQLESLSEVAKNTGQINLSFLSQIYSGNKEKVLECLNNQNMHAEAAFYARSYLPDQVEECVSSWKSALASSSKNKASKMIGTPHDFPNEF